MKLSVIVPVYNVAPYLERCLESCLHQDIEAGEYEIVVINDGSTDSSLSLVEKWAEGKTNIRIHSQENGGLSRARNAGLERAEGEYVWFVDADDSITPDCLGTLLEQCRRDHPDILAVGRSRWRSGTASTHRYNRELTRSVLSGKEAVKQGCMSSVCAPFYLFRRSFLEENHLRFLPGYFHEDEAFTPVAFYLAGRVSFSEMIGYHAYTREGSIMTTPNPKRAFDLLSIAEKLDEFSKPLPKGDRVLFSARIAEVLNQVMKHSVTFTGEIRDRMQERLWEDRRLLGHMLHSRKSSFVLTGAVLRLFPRHSLSLFRALFRLGSGLGLTARARA